jgi:D-lactate dehydrogenase (quinone)
VWVSGSTAVYGYAFVVVNSGLVHELRNIVGVRHVVTNPGASLRFRKGYRSGYGDALAVVRPGTLVELWKVLEAAVAADAVIIMQAANTGLTEGSVPERDDYGRDVIVINTMRIKGVTLINDGEQAVCYPGTTLYRLEQTLKEIGREPHSVIGSSMLGATVIGGIANNSGGSLVKRGPAYTEMALYARINEDGKLELVNHLGVELGDDPIQALAKLDTKRIPDKFVKDEGRAGYSKDYQFKVRDVEADTPARYNADPSQLYEASGSAGRIAVLAVRVDTFPSEGPAAVFYVGTNDPMVLTEIRRRMLTELKNLPVAGEYMHREIYDIAAQYGKDSFITIDKLGTDRLPYMFAAKARTENILDKTGLFKPYLPDRLLQQGGSFFPDHLPKRMGQYRDDYEHHLMIKTSGNGTEETKAFLTEFFKDHDGEFFEADAAESKYAFLQRFVAAGAAIRYHTMHQDEEVGLLALDVALPRNELNWFEVLPPELDEVIRHKLYYGHFFCYVFHQDYVLEPGVDEKEVKAKLLELFDARNAKYPAEHNVGHMYYAEEPLRDHYRELDPTNSMNPGIGKTPKLKNWED